MAEEESWELRLVMKAAASQAKSSGLTLGRRNHTRERLQSVVSQPFALYVLDFSVLIDTEIKGRPSLTSSK